jgi:hypothetical protein
VKKKKKRRTENAAKSERRRKSGRRDLVETATVRMTGSAAVDRAVQRTGKMKAGVVEAKIIVVIVDEGIVTTTILVTGEAVVIRVLRKIATNGTEGIDAMIDTGVSGVTVDRNQRMTATTTAVFAVRAIEVRTTESLVLEHTQKMKIDDEIVHENRKGETRRRRRDTKRSPGTDYRVHQEPLANQGVWVRVQTC